MKKVFLTGAALIAFAAAGFAQNQATVNQVGNAQSAVQNQTGNHLQSTISQDKQEGTNVGNFAGTYQTGTGEAGNQAIVDQNNGAKSNRAGLTQSSGTGNVGKITQSDNSGDGALPVTAATTAADVKAAGGNWGGILQQGSGNADTYIIQGNTAKKNFGEIYQYGDDNRQTSIDQSNNSTNNEAIIKQGTSGAGVSDNKAVVSQQGNSANNQAFVTQLGDSNDAVTTQNDNSTDNKATVEQTGYGASATILQRDYAAVNEATIKQSGFGNTALIDEHRDSYYNKAMITQAGFGNDATIAQTDLAAYNTATITQDGIGNGATISQVKANNNTATIKQSLGRPEGGSNTAEIQQGSLALAASNNTATITQDFSSNVAKLRQYGDGNTATFSQEVGDLNVIKGLGSSPYALQQGNNNMLTVTQNSGNGDSAYVPNTASVSQIGDGNSISIMQTGSN